jgi:hypothetical protein
VIAIKSPSTQSTIFSHTLSHSLTHSLSLSLSLSLSQDHQEPHYPVYYSSGKPLNPVAGNSAPSDSQEAQAVAEAPKNPWEPGASNVFGAGGKIYQYPGRGGTR